MIQIIIDMGEKNIIFCVSILFYLGAGLVGLILMKHEKQCNVISNVFCIIGGAFGIVGSLMKLLIGYTESTMTLFQSSISMLSIEIKIDNLSAFFVLCLSILVIAVSMYSIGYNTHYFGKRNIGLFNFLYATFILSMFFVMVAKNAIVFYAAWEAMAVISYFLVIFEAEKEENQKAGKLYLIMTHIGTAFLLIAFMMMYYYTQSFDLSISSNSIPIGAKNMMFILFFIGFGTKAGMIPLHIWLPYAHPAAPSNVSALMSGIMIKTAIYGMIRFMLYYLEIQATWWGVVILSFGIVSAVLGVAYALMEDNIKKMLAFSSVENIGIILIGLGVAFIGFAQNNSMLGGLALGAGLLHTLNHTLFKGGLFMGAGSIQYATGSKEMNQLGGLIKKMPMTGLLVLVFSLAISGIVPFNGFVSEWLTYQSLFLSIGLGKAGLNILGILGIAGLGFTGALALGCFVKLFGISFLGLPRSDVAKNAKEVPKIMNCGMGMIGIMCLLIGIFPKMFLKSIDGVIFDILGKAENSQEVFLKAYTPLVISGNHISPIEIMIAVLAIAMMTLIVIRFIGGKQKVKQYGTWDCGFNGLNSRTQYTATGFSKPLGIVLSVLYKSGRQVEIEEGASSYFPRAIRYKVWTEPIFEKYLYAPVVSVIRNISLKILVAIKTGSVHAYLIYIFVSVLGLMLYNRLV
jgi:formate hydrogenlyase subunit 3/multisubunit Na+/H+ antiporter MnhD subunit